MSSVEIEFRVRWYQRRFHEALVNRTHNRLMAVWHRRAGKDEIVLNAMRELALKDPGTYWHCFPEQKQARKAIWNGVNGHTGKRRIFEAFPERLIKRMQDDDMFIELCNGATFQLIGSDRYDSTVGSGPKGIAYSEWALSNPSAWAYHSPMIRETKGFAAFITTPRGRNHAKTMIDRATTSDDWFSETLSINDTKALSSEDLAEALAEYEDIYGKDQGRAIYEQEYLCSFTAAILGAFYALEMRDVRASRVMEIDPVNGPVHRAWDLGVRDSTAIWWFQIVGNKLLVHDYYAANGVGVQHYAKVIEEKNYTPGLDFVPHDAKVKEWGTDRTRVETMLDLGLHPRVVPRSSDADGHQAIRTTLPCTTFHPRCEAGLSCLESYRREWDDVLKAFKANALHDWASHGAKAFQYLSQSWREIQEDEPKADPIAEMLRPKTLNEVLELYDMEQEQ